MGLFDFVTDILGGGKKSGLGKIASGLGRAGEAESAFLDYLKGQYSPYMQAGQTALGEYLPAIQAMADPQAFYEQMMTGYETSPETQMKMEEGIRAATQGAAAAGGLGGGELMKGLERYGQQLTAADQQQWLQNMLGIRGGYTGGLQSLIGGGKQALGTLAPVGAQVTGNIADLIAQQAMAQGMGTMAGYQPYTQWLGKGISGLTGMLTGGAGSLMGAGGAGSLMGLGI